MEYPCKAITRGRIVGMRKNVKKLTASALLLALLFGTNPLFAAQSISELKNKQSDINSSI